MIKDLFKLIKSHRLLSPRPDENSGIKKIFEGNKNISEALISFSRNATLGDKRELLWAIRLAGDSAISAIPYIVYLLRETESITQEVNEKGKFLFILYAEMREGAFRLLLEYGKDAQINRELIRIISAGREIDRFRDVGTDGITGMGDPFPNILDQAIIAFSVGNIKPWLKQRILLDLLDDDDKTTSLISLIGLSHFNDHNQAIINQFASILISGSPYMKLTALYALRRVPNIPDDIRPLIVDFVKNPYSVIAGSAPYCTHYYYLHVLLDRPIWLRKKGEWLSFEELRDIYDSNYSTAKKWAIEVLSKMDGD